MSIKAKWIIYSITGLLLIGAGLSIFGEALVIKTLDPEGDRSWFWWGTSSLIVFNTGICFVAQATIFRLSLNKTPLPQDDQ